MRQFRFTALVAALAAGSVVAGTAWAQTAPRDPVADLLPSTAPTASAQTEASVSVADGQTDNGTTDAEQIPEEVRITRALNAEVAAQSTLADNQTAAEREAVELQQREAAAEWSVGAAEFEARNQAALREAAEAQARYDLAMADWRATVAACERGDRARCAAGSQPARVPMP